MLFQVHLVLLQSLAFLVRAHFPKILVGIIGDGDETLPYIIGEGVFKNRVGLVVADFWKLGSDAFRRVDSPSCYDWDPRRDTINVGSPGLLYGEPWRSFLLKPGRCARTGTCACTRGRRRSWSGRSFLGGYCQNYHSFHPCTSLNQLGVAHNFKPVFFRNHKAANFQKSLERFISLVWGGHTHQYYRLGSPVNLYCFAYGIW